MTKPGGGSKVAGLMASVNDFVARGKVIAVKDGHVVFNPAGFNYELHFTTARPFTGPLDTYIEVLLRVKARKVYTVPSGGNFISPLFGPPRTLQGRALYVEDRVIVIKAAAPIAIELPEGSDAIDLSEGGIRAGVLVNVAALPGATMAITVGESVAV